MNMTSNATEGSVVCCLNCGKELPNFQPAPRKRPACESPDCRRAVYNVPAPKKRIIAEGEVICAHEGCIRPVPAGAYDIRKTLIFCSRRCERKHYGANYIVGYCKCCGGPIHDYPFQMGKREFCSIEHKQIYQGQQRLERETGIFASLLTEYLAGFGKIHYTPRALKTKRLELISFLGFVNEHGITDLEDVGPQVATAYVARELSRGLQHRNFVGGISTFFDWMRAEGRRKGPNPVVPRIHNTRTREYMPRPYSDLELEERWRVVEAHGTPLEKLAFSIGIECGLRVGEVGNVRLSDVDEVAQRIFVRLPTKNKTPRKPFYHENVKKYLAEWMKHRDPYCGHDHLLHNDHARPIKDSGYIQTTIKDTLVMHGITEFSFHRLRHTWATRLAANGADLATVMELGGWRTWDGMKRYLQLSQKRMEERYFDAMEKAKSDRELADEKVVSLYDFALMDGEDDASDTSARG